MPIGISLDAAQPTYGYSPFAIGLPVHVYAVIEKDPTYTSCGSVTNDEFVRSLARKGDSGIIGINPGEVVLTKEKARALLDTIIPVSEALADSIRTSNYSNVVNKHPVQEINLQYGSLLTVNGNVDRDALPGLQTILEKSYQYTSKQLMYELRKNGTK